MTNQPRDYQNADTDDPKLKAKLLAKEERRKLKQQQQQQQ